MSTKKRKSRQGHRLLIRKSLEELNTILTETIERAKPRLEHLKVVLEEQISRVKVLDEEILVLLQDGDEKNDDDIANHQLTFELK